MVNYESWFNRILVVAIIGLVGLTVYSSFAKDAINISPIIFVAILGFVLFFLYRIAIGTTEKTIGAEDIILILLGLAVIFAIFYFVPGLIPTSFNSVVQETFSIIGLP
jgi:uncharacterized membrane-anchored protein